MKRTPNLAAPPVNHTLSGLDSFPGSNSFRLLTGATRPEAPLGSIKALAKPVYHREKCCCFFLLFWKCHPMPFDKTADGAASSLASLAAARLAFTCCILPPFFFSVLSCRTHLLGISLAKMLAGCVKLTSVDDVFCWRLHIFKNVIQWSCKNSFISEYFLRL